MCDQVTKVDFNDLKSSYKVTSKKPQHKLDFKDALPHSHAGWRSTIAQARVMIAIEELWAESAAQYKDLTLMQRPRAVVATKTFQKGCLTLVPATRRIQVKSLSDDAPKHPYLDLGVLDAPMGDRKGQRYFLGPDLPSEQHGEDRPTSENKDPPTPFVVPFWFVCANALDDDEELTSQNMELYLEEKTVGNVRIKIPCMRNTKNIKVGTILRIVAPKAEEHPKKRQKTMPQNA